MAQRSTGKQHYATIGEVVQELSAGFPDVTHSSLRFLEREGLITPTRTPGGHRLYSRETVERIVRIKTWQLERLSLQDIRARLNEHDRLKRPRSITTAFLQSALAGDFAGAAGMIARIDDIGLPLTSLFGDVLTPALTEVGERWERGEISPAVEKGISELSRELIATISLRHARPDNDRATVVAACVEGEQHELGLRMICGLLRSQGYRVYFLGADVAPVFLVDAFNLHHPRFVLLSAKLVSTRNAIETAIVSIGQADHPVPGSNIFVGGEASALFAEQIRALGATPVPDQNPARAVATIVDLVERSASMKSKIHESPPAP